MLDVVDKKGSVPIYVQLKRTLRAAILDGTLADRAPSERGLARRYDVAQMTARRAIMELVDEGFLYRQVGRGTFVRRPGSAVPKTFTLAFVLHPGVSEGLRNPYFSGVLQGVEEAARGEGYSLVYTSSLEELIDGPDDPQRGGRKADGVLAVALADEGAVRRAARVVPTVVLDNEFDGMECVVVDNVSGARMAVSHLAGLGHRRIGHLAGPRASAVGRGRLAGYRSALAEHGLPYDPGRVHDGWFTYESGAAGVDWLMDRPDRPTAIFCANDAVALGAMKRLRRRGLSVPGDVSLVGFDDIEPARMVDPGLTTVRVPRKALGVLAVDVLLSLIRGDGEGRAAGRHLVDVQLVERASCRRI